MILCDFDDLTTEEFHLKFFDTVVQGNIELVQEILQHTTLAKRFDISYNHYYCIIASIMNSQQINHCHMDLLKLFTQSPLLKKHANPVLCSQDDIFCGPLGNAIIFTDINTVRYIGKFFDNTNCKLQELIGLAIFNNKKDAFFYLVNERHFVIQNTDIILKALVNFPQVDSDIVDYIKKINSNNILNNISPSTDMHKVLTKKQQKNKPTSLPYFLLNLSSEQTHHLPPSWGSRFRQKF